MDLGHTGRLARSNAPTPSGASTPHPPPPGGHTPALPARWKLDRLPDGSYRIRPTHLKSLPLIALAILLYGTFGVDDSSGGAHRTPEDMLFMFCLLLVPVLLICTWAEEWRIRPGQVEVRKRIFGFWRSRTLINGRFVVEAPAAKARIASSWTAARQATAPAKPSPFRWLAVLGVPLGIYMVFLSTDIMEASIPLFGKPAPAPFKGFPPETLRVLSRILLYAGGIVAIASFGLISLFGLQSSRSTRSSTQPPMPRSKRLRLRSGQEEFTLPGSDTGMGTLELNAMAAWFGALTGWLVEAAAMPVTLAPSPGVSMDTHPAAPPIRQVPGEPPPYQPGEPPPYQPGEPPPYQPGVPPTLPDDWTAESRPDGSQRIVPSFIRSQETNKMFAVLGAIGVIGLLAMEGFTEHSVGWLVVAAAVSIAVFGRDEAWIVGRGRIEVHRRSKFVWTRRRYGRGTIMVRPYPKDRSPVDWKRLVVPSACFFGGILMIYLYIAFIQPRLPEVVRTDTTDRIVLGSLIVLMMLGLLLYPMLPKGFGASGPVVESESRLYLRASGPGFGPGSGKLDIVDLLENNRRTRRNPGWVPTTDELRALAAWLSVETGWPVGEVD